jgi:hypothetical protein
MAGAPSSNAAPHSATEVPAMADILWLAVLAGLFLLTLAFVRLCDAR